MLGNSALVYNSATIDPRPIIVSTVRLRCDDPNPTSITVNWSWDGVAQTAATFTVPGGLDGPYLVAVQAPSGNATGVHTWQTTVTYTLPDTTVVAAGTASGEVAVVNQSASAFGAGWSIAGVNRLESFADGVMYVSGQTGTARIFRAGAGGSFQNPANDFGTLVQNGDGSYTYTAKDQTRFEFDSAGRLTQAVDTHNLTRTFSYDGSGRLSTIASPDTTNVTLTYDGSGQLSTVEGRTGTVTVTHDGSGNIDAITNPDGNTRTVLVKNLGRGKRAS